MNNLKSLLFLLNIFIFELIFNSFLINYKLLIFPYLMVLILFSIENFQNKNIFILALISLSYEVFFSTYPLGFYIVIHLVIYITANILNELITANLSVYKNSLVFFICSIIYSIPTLTIRNDFIFFVKIYFINLLIFNFIIYLRNRV